MGHAHQPPLAVPPAHPIRHPELDRFIAVVERLRRECSWDAEQAHRTLVPYLVEETYELVEAIETLDADPAGGAAHLREELGDVLLQVVIHATIAAERSDVGLEDVARDVADKLVARHPYVFAGADQPPNLSSSWEQRKAVEKGRRSALDGVPEMSALARAAKVVGRARAHGVAVDLPVEPVSADEVAAQLLALVGRAQASGVDAEQALRTSLRAYEQSVRRVEDVDHVPPVDPIPP